MRSIQWGEQLHEAGEGSWGHFCHGKKLLYLNWMGVSCGFHGEMGRVPTLRGPTFVAEQK